LVSGEDSERSDSQDVSCDKTNESIGHEQQDAMGDEEPGPSTAFFYSRRNEEEECREIEQVEEQQNIDEEVSYSCNDLII